MQICRVRSLSTGIHVHVFMLGAEWWVGGLSGGALGPFYCWSVFLILFLHIKNTISGKCELVDVDNDDNIDLQKHPLGYADPFFGEAGSLAQTCSSWQCTSIYFGHRARLI